MSFALTTSQIRGRQKTVTRRMGWTFLNPGALLQPVVKSQGLRKGEKVEKIGPPIKVVSVRRESLAILMVRPTYGRREVINEGFPWMTRPQFVKMFARTHDCDPDAKVTRIEFKYGGFCVECGCEIAGTEPNLCGECSCEEDGL